ncbi:hypothetical protein I317_05323 [Kwoniella heveanensis CBS 569]|nr:hypothetical protein I317_05323 [Kwoniella heveanensis CBS 569]
MEELQLQQHRTRSQGSVSHEASNVADFGSSSVAMAAAPEISIPTPSEQNGLSSAQSGGLHARTVEHSADNSGFGTLVISRGGRSKYLGPTAGSEWLKDSETQDNLDTPWVSRAPSPEAVSFSQYTPAPLSLHPIAFPFNTGSAPISTKSLLSELPSREEAEVLVDSYYRYCAWHHDVVPRHNFRKLFDRIFDVLPAAGDTRPTVAPQELALLYIVLAQGTLFNIEMPYNDPSAEHWLQLSERALVKSDFFANNTIPAIQTLHLMAHYHLHIDKGRRGDYAWPLWGLVMRLIQAMGMHRDGARWNLPDDVVEERRKVFWECRTADTFQAHCFSRPCILNPEHCDTAYPFMPVSTNGEKCYSALRFELSQLSGEILNMAMKVERPPYSTVTDLYQRLCQFEHDLPFSLRCRAAMLATPSRFSDPSVAIASSPEPSKRSVSQSFQQTSLALNISETIIFLHRPYFAKALYSDNRDRMRSVYAPSYLAVIERCGVIISMISDIHGRFPSVSTRQWHFWYHVFNAAVCVGTLVLRDPHNPLANFAITQIDGAIRLMTLLIQSGASSQRPVKNLQWLHQLRARAVAKMGASQDQESTLPTHVDETSDDDSEDVELLGWRTRLIEAGSKSKPTAKTIESVPSAPPTEPPSAVPYSHPFDFSDPTAFSFPDDAEPMADPVLQQFWDPIILQDFFNPTEGRSSSSLV